MPGPPPKPYLVKKREGNPGHQKLNPGPAYSGDFGPAPKWLGSHGRKLWKQVGPQLKEQGLCASVYRTALLGLCANWQKVVSCETVLAEKGPTYEILKEAGKDADGNPKYVCTYIAQRPEVAMAFKAWDKIRQFGALFGFSPADVQKVVVEKAKEQSLREELMG